MSDGKKLNEVIVDGGYIEMLNAVYAGVVNAKDKILNDVKETLQLLVSPDEWEEVWNAILVALENPIEFAIKMLEFLEKEFNSIYRKIQVICQDETSTKEGRAILLSKYIPEEAIPFIIANISPLKVKGIVEGLKQAKKISLEIGEKVVKGERLVKNERVLFGEGITNIPISGEARDLVEKIRHYKSSQKKVDVLQREFRMFEQFGDPSGLESLIDNLRLDANKGKLVAQGYPASKFADDLEKYVSKNRDKYKYIPENQSTMPHEHSRLSEVKRSPIDEDITLLKADRQKRIETLEKEPNKIRDYFFVDILNKMHSNGINKDIRIVTEQGVEEIGFFKKYIEAKISYGSKEEFIKQSEDRFVRDFNTMAFSHTGENPRAKTIQDLEIYINNLKNNDR